MSKAISFIRQSLMRFQNARRGLRTIELVDSWRAGVETVLIGAREDSGFPSNHVLAGYGLVNLRAGWSITPDWTLEARIDNAADKD